MALAIDAIGSGSNISVGAGGSLTWTHTCTGANRFLVVGVVTSRSDANIVSVTYNGVSMTESQAASGTSSFVSSIWYLKNPATGANTVAVNITSADEVLGGSVSFTGADQTTQPDASGTSNATTSTPSVSLTTVAANTIIVDCIETSSSQTFTSNNAGQTTQVDLSPDLKLRMTTKSAVSSGPNTMGYTMGASAAYGIVALSVTPAAGGGASVFSSTLMTMGVG